MQYRLPRPAPLTLFFQCTVMVTVGIGLFLYLHARQEQRTLEETNRLLRERRNQIQRAWNQINEYRQFVDSHPFYQSHLRPPRWERISAAWEDLPFPELLDRLSDLYRPERPFVLEAFTVSQVDKGKGLTPSPAGEAPAVTQETGPSDAGQIFKLEGYVLCPCQ